jgi:hypothetical protein
MSLEKILLAGANSLLTSKAANLDGLSRVALQKILRRTGLEPANYRSD